MTGNDIGEGTRVHRADVRRNRLITAAWIASVLLLVVAMTQVQDGRGPGSLSETAGIGFAVGLVLAIGLGNLMFFRSIDELEIRENFVALTVGFLTNMVMVIGWLPLFFAELAGPPDAVACLFISSVASALVYGWLKLRRT